MKQKRHELIQAMFLHYDSIFFKGSLMRMIQMRKIKLHLTSDPSLRDVLGIFRIRSLAPVSEYEIQIAGDQGFVASRDYEEMEVINCVGKSVRNNLELLQSILEHMIVHFLEQSCDPHATTDDRVHTIGFQKAAFGLFHHTHSSSHRAKLARKQRPSSDPDGADGGYDGHEEKTRKQASNHTLVIGQAVVFCDTRVANGKPQKGAVAKLNKKTLQIKLPNNMIWVGNYEHCRLVR